MAESNFLLNGRFLHNLNGWTVSDAAVVYNAGDADDHYGVCVLPTGNKSIQQDFAVIGVRTFTVHLSVKAIGANLSGSNATLVILDGDGNTLVTQNLSGTADTWTENTFNFGLAEGTTYSFVVENNNASGDVRIDDLWLWFIPLTRLQMAERVYAKLGRLATDRSLSTTPSGSLTEGSYTYAIDAALRFVGAIDPDTGLPDVRWLDEQTVQNALNYVERQMLEQLQKDYAVEVDTQTGPYQQSLSQKRDAITEMLGGSDSGGGASSSAVVMRELTHD